MLLLFYLTTCSLHLLYTEKQHNTTCENKNYENGAPYLPYLMSLTLAFHYGA